MPAGSAPHTIQCRGDCSAAEIRPVHPFLLTALALAFFAVGIDIAGYGLTALALGGAALNACTGLCLGCKAYVLIRRLQSAGPELDEINARST